MGGATSDSSIHGGSQAKTYWPLKPVGHAERRGFVTQLNLQGELRLPHLVT